MNAQTSFDLGELNRNISCLEASLKVLPDMARGELPSQRGLGELVKSQQEMGIAALTTAYGMGVEASLAEAAKLGQAGALHLAMEFYREAIGYAQRGGFAIAGRLETCEPLFGVWCVTKRVPTNLYAVMNDTRRYEGAVITDVMKDILRYEELMKPKE